MDHGHFDDVTRAMATGTGPRRAALRFLTGGALAGLAAWFGQDDAVEARPHHRHNGAGKHGKRRRPNEVQQAGKNKNHKKQKHKQRKPKQPEPCAAEQFLCDDGTCITTDQCCPGERQCPEGCVGNGHCCIGENECEDGSCLTGDQCCPEERVCADGSCHSQLVCCPEEQRCGGNCIPADLCCEDDPDPLCSECEEIACKHGSKECRSTCHYEDSVCCKGECLLPCGGGQQINLDTCQCECPPGTVLLADGTCCQDRRACRPTWDGHTWKNSICCAEGTLCWAGSNCCPAEWSGMSVCHSDACPCFLCSNPPPGCIPTE